MNIFITILSCLLLGVLNSCQPPVVFGEAQPVGTESISSIPESYMGIYWCKTDSVSLFIDNKAFIKSKDFLVSMTIEEIEDDPDLELQKGKIYVRSLGQSFPIQNKGDTIISTIIIKDTLFVIGPEQILKPFKGHLILNTKLDENAWGVMLVSHEGEGILSLAYAELPENLSVLDSITPVKTLAKKDNIETQILIRPTRDEFERILKNRILFDASYYEFEQTFPLKTYGF
jgi:hypothetical protein